MKVFYLCQTGVHTALLAGYIHLGAINQDQEISKKVLLSLNNFDNISASDVGKICFLGKTAEEIEIYSLGVLDDKKLGLTSVLSLLESFNIAENDYLLVDTFNCTNFFTKLGIKIRLFFGKNLLSNLLIIGGLRQNFMKINEIVVGTKLMIKKGG